MTLKTDYKQGDPNPAGAVNTTNTQVNTNTLAIASSAPGSDVWLKAVVNGDSYDRTVTTYDANGAIDVANVTWPDGRTGTFTTTETSETFLGAIDAFTITYVGVDVVKTITQGSVTRNAAGQITVQPVLTIA